MVCEATARGHGRSRWIPGFQCRAQARCPADFLGRAEPHENSSIRTRVAAIRLPHRAQRPLPCLPLPRAGPSWCTRARSFLKRRERISRRGGCLRREVERGECRHRCLKLPISALAIFAAQVVSPPTFFVTDTLPDGLKALAREVAGGGAKTTWLSACPGCADRGVRGESGCARRASWMLHIGHPHVMILHAAFRLARRAGADRGIGGILDLAFRVQSVRLRIATRIRSRVASLLTLLDVLDADEPPTRKLLLQARRLPGCAVEGTEFLEGCRYKSPSHTRAAGRRDQPESDIVRLPPAARVLPHVYALKHAPARVRNYTARGTVVGAIETVRSRGDAGLRMSDSPT